MLDKTIFDYIDFIRSRGYLHYFDLLPSGSFYDEEYVHIVKFNSFRIYLYENNFKYWLIYFKNHGDTYNCEIDKLTKEISKICYRNEDQRWYKELTIQEFIDEISLIDSISDKEFLKDKIINRFEIELQKFLPYNLLIDKPMIGKVIHYANLTDEEDKHFDNLSRSTFGYKHLYDDFVLKQSLKHTQLLHFIPGINYLKKNNIESLDEVISWLESSNSYVVNKERLLKKYSYHMNLEINDLGINLVFNIS